MRAIPMIALTLAILLLALTGGGIFPWTVLAAGAMLCFVLIIRPASFDTPPAHAKPWFSLVSPSTFLLLYLGFMLLPLPVGLTRVMGTSRYQQHVRVTETIEAIAEIDPDIKSFPLFSLTRSRAGTLRFLAYLIPMIAGWHIVKESSPQQRHVWLRCLLAAGACMALAGMVGRWIVPQGDTLWWTLPVPHGRPGPMGGFMNRNHYAGFNAILAPGALALAMHDSRQRRYALAIASTIGFCLLAGGTFLSLSRGGMLALCGGVAVTVLLDRNRFSRQWIVTVLLLVLLAAIPLSMLQPVQERVRSMATPFSETSLQSRALAWRDSLRIALHYPLLGAGPNAFRSVYPQHRTTSAREARDFAENEYVQWIAETGLAGILIFFLFAKRLIPQLFFFPHGKQMPYLPFGAIAAGSFTAAGIHAWGDFPMRLPVYALTVVCLAALCQSPSPADNNTNSDRATDPPWRTRVRPSAVAGCLLVFLLFFSDRQSDTAVGISGLTLPATARALAATPSSPLLWRHAAAQGFQHDHPSFRPLALNMLTQAAAYDPNNYRLWKRLGDARLDNGDKEGALEAYRQVRQLRDWVKVPITLEEIR